MSRIAILMLLAVATISCTADRSSENAKPAPTQPINLEDKVSNADKDDPDMNAAMAKARSTLPEFWKHAMSPGPKEDQFAVKVPIKEGEQTEYFWLGNLGMDGDKLYGDVSNDPEIVHNVKLGDRREIADADIVDWMYYRDDKIVGNYTVRALFKNMSPEDVKEVKSQLANP